MKSQNPDNQNNEQIDGISDRLLRTARESIDRNFPNPDRIGCPGQAILGSLARSSNLPPSEIRAHLLRCAPCINHFTSEKAAYQDSQPTWIRPPAKAATMAWTLAVFSLATLTIAAIITLYSTQKRDNEIAGVQSNQVGQHLSADEIPKPTSVETYVPESETSSVSSDPSPPSASPKRDKVVIDILQSAVVRSSEVANSVFRIRPVRVPLIFKLVPSSPAGFYEVSVFEENGKRVGRVSEVQSDGKTVSMELDFSSLPADIRICVGLKGEVPDCFPVKVGR